MNFPIQKHRILPTLGQEPPLQHPVIQAANFAKSAAKVVRHALNTGRVFVTKEQREERVAICPTCEFFRASDKRCGHEDCNCPHTRRAAFEGVHCPVNKW